MNETNRELRVFVDSNILISAVLSEKSMSGRLLRLLIEHYDLIICSYSLTEVSKMIQRKFPNHMAKWDKSLAT